MIFHGNVTTMTLQNTSMFNSLRSRVCALRMNSVPFKRKHNNRSLLIFGHEVLRPHHSVHWMRLPFYKKEMLALMEESCSSVAFLVNDIAIISKMVLTIDDYDKSGKDLNDYSLLRKI